MRTVRHGHTVAGNPHLPTDSRHGLPRPASTATGRAIPTTAARTSRRSVRNLPTTIAVIRSSRALTIRRPLALTRSRERIPPLAAAIRLRLAPTPHRPIPLLAAAIAVEVAAAVTAVVVAEAVPIVVEVAAPHTVVVVAEVHTAVEGPALTADTNLFLKFKIPAEFFGRSFCFSCSAHSG